MADIIIPKASETPLALTASYAQKTQMSEVIRKLNQRIGICGDFIKDSIYNASSLDMSDKAIERIQNKIRAILD